MSHGAKPSTHPLKRVAQRIAVQGPVDHITSFLCFWKPSIARRITFYFFIFGLMIFLLSASLYVVAAKRTFLKSMGSLIQDQFSQIEDASSPDDLMNRVNTSQPKIHRMFTLLSSLSSIYYAVSDVAFYRRMPTAPEWTRMYFPVDDVLQEIPVSSPSLEKLDHRLDRRFHRLQANILEADGTVTMFVNLTQANDLNRYFLGIELDSEMFFGFLRSQLRLFFLFLLIGMVVTRLLAHIFVRKIVRPIEALSDTVSKVAQGDLSQEVPLTTRDEIGQLAAGVNIMVGELREWDRIKRIEFELEKGQEIQREFLPRRIPELPNWEIATCFQPAGKVSGDFYDVFMLESGRMGLVIGDVCDKGVGSALYMALFRSLIRVFSTQLGGQQEAPETRSEEMFPSYLGSDLEVCLDAVSMTNDYIAKIHGDEGMFATIFFGILDPSSGVLRYINGGHEPLLHIGAGGVKAHLNPTGPAVGMMPEMDFDIRQICLSPGDILLGYTDGLTEARSPGDELFSRDRLNALFNPPESSAGRLLQRIESNLFRFIGVAPRHDDVTMLAIQRNIR